MISFEPKGPFPVEACRPEEVEKIIHINLSEDVQPFTKEEEFILRRVVSLSGAYCLCDSSLSYLLRGIRCQSKLLTEEGAVVEIILNIIVPNAWPRAEDEEFFKSGDFRKLFRDESTRRSFAHCMFKELLGLGYERVHHLSVYEVTNLVKNPSFHDWQEAECGLGLAVCLVEADVHLKFKSCKKLVERHVIGEGFLRVNAYRTDDIGILNLMLKAANLRLITVVNRQFPIITDWGKPMWKYS